MPTELPPGLLLVLAIVVIAFAFIVLRGGDKEDTEAKERLLGAIPNRIELLPVKPEDFPSLDSEALQNYTKSLEALGFVFSLDFSLDYDIKMAVRGYCRFFTHPERQCFAEISQAFPKDQKPISVGCSIGSLLEENWGVATTDRKMEPIHYAWRRPRILWTSHPNASPADLLAKHLDLRGRMAEELHIRPLVDVTLEAYLAHERKDMADRKAVLKSKSMETIRSEMHEFVLDPRDEWLGDFAVVVDDEDVS